MLINASAMPQNLHIQKEQSVMFHQYSHFLQQVSEVDWDGPNENVSLAGARRRVCRGQLTNVAPILDILNLPLVESQLVVEILTIQLK